MFSPTDITAKAWYAVEVINLRLQPEFTVDKVFLIGSYASGKANEWSDVDFLVQLKNDQPLLSYPTWKKMQEIHTELFPKRMHIIFGTREAQESLHKKYNKPYKEISLGGINVTGSHAPKIAS